MLKFVRLLPGSAFIVRPLSYINRRQKKSRVRFLVPRISSWFLRIRSLRRGRTLWISLHDVNDMLIVKRQNSGKKLIDRLTALITGMATLKWHLGSNRPPGSAFVEVYKYTTELQRPVSANWTLSPSGLIIYRRHWFLNALRSCTVFTSKYELALETGRRSAVQSLSTSKN